MVVMFIESKHIDLRLSELEGTPETHNPPLHNSR